MFVLAVTDSVTELVSEAEPLLLDEDLKSGKRSVVRIEEKHGQRRQLRRSVPPV